ncbi:MAG TPA: hypothetical protein VMK12_19235, partial [Anaeromyxobacteraceae bacterium]|nr:hypothetical protein [Anaeromyxobacteraceae bacterium]
MLYQAEPLPDVNRLPASGTGNRRLLASGVEASQTADPGTAAVASEEARGGAGSPVRGLDGRECGPNNSLGLQHTPAEITPSPAPGSDDLVPTAQSGVEQIVARLKAGERTIDVSGLHGSARGLVVRQLLAQALGPIVAV